MGIDDHECLWMQAAAAACIADHLVVVLLQLLALQTTGQLVHDAALFVRGLVVTQQLERSGSLDTSGVIVSVWCPFLTVLTTKGYDHKTPIRTSFDQRFNRYSQLSPSIRWSCRWDSACCLLVLYVALALPPQVAFADSSKFGWFRAVDLLSDAFFAIDVYVHLRTGAPPLAGLHFVVVVLLVRPAFCSCCCACSSGVRLIDCVTLSAVAPPTFGPLFLHGGCRALRV